MGEGPEGRGWACWRRRLPEAGEPAADHLSVEAKVERKILERGTSHSGMLGGGRPSKAGLKEEMVVQAGLPVPRGDGDRGVGHWVVKPQTAEATWQSGCQSSSFGGHRGRWQQGPDHLHSREMARGHGAPGRDSEQPPRTVLHGCSHT